MLELARRAASLATGRIQSLPILSLMVHSACNCKCVMCDIWKANADKREISVADLERHLEGIRQLRVQRVMLTGGEPLLHANLWALCERLAAEGIPITLVTTGLLAERQAADIARWVDELVVSIDGPPDIHDAIRRVPGGFERIRRGIAALRQQTRTPHLIARSVIQKANVAVLSDSVAAIEGIGVDRCSFLAADVTSTAFNRATPWSRERQQEIALTRDDLPVLADAITAVERVCASALQRGFVEGGVASLNRIYQRYAAAAGSGEWPRARCNAPWVSAVLEADGRLRPCFFQPAYESQPGDVQTMINAPQAIRFRRNLDVETNDICQRCVCSLALPLTARA